MDRIRRAVVAAICLAGCGTKEPVPETPNILTDNRDGQKYQTVVIGGKRWMAQNLNYRTDSSWCWGNDTTYCNKYGRLYAWNAANKACPAGYHLPSRKEWNNLAQAVGGKRRVDMESNNGTVVWGDAGRLLKSKSGWEGDLDANGTDGYDFSALPGGYRYKNSYLDSELISKWWTASEHGSDSAYSRDIHQFSPFVYESSNNKSEGLSVRCVADTP